MAKLKHGQNANIAKLRAANAGLRERLAKVVAKTSSSPGRVGLLSCALLGAALRGSSRLQLQRMQWCASRSGLREQPCARALQRLRPGDWHDPAKLLLS